MEYTFANGVVKKKDTSGTFHGVYITELSGGFSSTALKDGEKCVFREDEEQEYELVEVEEVREEKFFLE